MDDALVETLSRTPSPSPTSDDDDEPAAINVHPKRLHVGRMSFSSTDEGLRSFFAQFGEMQECDVMRDKDGKSRGACMRIFICSLVCGLIICVLLAMLLLSFGIHRLCLCHVCEC